MFATTLKVTLAIVGIIFGLTLSYLIPYNLVLRAISGLDVQDSDRNVAAVCGMCCFIFTFIFVAVSLCEYIGMRF